jgi:hypothetical protein
MLVEVENQWEKEFQDVDLVPISPRDEGKKKAG